LNISFLKLEENGLRSLANIEKLQKLESLFLSGNRLSDFNELDKLCELENLVELVLTSNPIIRKNMYRATVIKKLPQLVILDGRVRKIIFLIIN
jgi:acidic leucine-rich nuclear phosphoprotein 32 family member A/C/D